MNSCPLDDIYRMSPKRIKLAQFAKEQDIAYITAYRHWQQGNIEGIQLPGGTILVTGWVEKELTNTEKELAIIYSRVSSNNQKLKLKTQTTTLSNFAHDQGYEIIDTVEEVGTGFSDKRTGLLSILHRTDWNVLIVEDNSSILKFGYPYLSVLLKQNGKEIISRKDVEEAEISSTDIIEASGELELSVLIKRVRDLIRPLIGVAGQKNAIERNIQNLLD